MANNASPERIPLILTRPKPASESFFATLPENVRTRFDPIFSPLINIVDLGTPVSMSRRDAAIFTSANGVEFAPEGDGRTAFCVGDATTQAAKRRGWAAKQAGLDAKALIATLIAKRPKQRLFHLSGKHTRGDVAGHLDQSGLSVEHLTLYDQQLCDLTETAANSLLREKRVIVPLFSPRTAAQFVAVAPRTTSVHVISLSASVADALGSAPLASLTIATQPDAQAMGAAIDELTKTT